MFPNKQACRLSTLTLCGVMAGAFLLLSPSSGEARPEMASRNVEARFQAMDADKDGKVSREEFFAAHPQMKEGAFTSIDANADGAVNLEEWTAFSAGHGSSDPHGGQGGDVPPHPEKDGTDGNMQHRPGNGEMPKLIMPPAANRQ